MDLFKFFRKKPVRLQVVRVNESKLRLADWQNDPRLCSAAAKTLDGDYMKMMLSVLKNEHPANITLTFGVPANDRLVHQARCEGYSICLANLEALALNTTPIPMPEVVFADEEHG